MTTDWDRQGRGSSRRFGELRELNPHVEVETVGENVDEANAAKLVEPVRCDRQCRAAVRRAHW